MRSQIKEFCILFMTVLLIPYYSYSIAKAGECDRAMSDPDYAPRIRAFNPHGDRSQVSLMWSYTGPCQDFYQIRWGIVGRGEDQFKTDGGPCQVVDNLGNTTCGHLFTNLNGDKPYHFIVQGCNSHFLQSSSCTAWSQPAFILPYGPDTCKNGFVWREASPSDHICVPLETRTQTQNDNAQAANRIDPNNHSFGPDTCQQGFVWREAFPNDHVCVPPQTRQQAKDDNSQAGNRRARP